MDGKQPWHIVLVIALLAAASGTLYWALTRTEEVPLILSKASLKGKVSYKGKPVPHALIIVTSDQTSATGQADDGGQYFVQYSPTGSVSIGVNTDAGKGMLRGAMIAASMSREKNDKPQFVEVPQKYFAPETSGITANLQNKDGLNEFDIDIR